MGRYQAEALVVSVKDWGESDRLVMLFSRELGKISALAYGAKRPRSQLAGGMQLFSHVEVSLSPGKVFEQVKQCEIKNSFRIIKEDLSRMAYGMFMLEVLNELCPERQPESELFDKLLAALALLGRKNPRLVALAWGWQVLAEMGLSPQLDYCVFCGKDSEIARFDSRSGGCCCQTCGNAESSVMINAETILFLQVLSRLDWISPPEFKITGSTLVQAERLVLDYLIHCLDKPLKSTEFIRQVGR
jgi:DNA repair protein RecO (recombination protein O)